MAIRETRAESGTMYRKKKIVIMVMCGMVLMMAIGYATLFTQLNINGISNIDSNWNIVITKVESSAIGRAYNIKEPTYAATNMTFNVGVKEPGDKMTFFVTVKNNGNVDAILDSIDATVNGSDEIKYSIGGIQAKTRLAAGASKSFSVTTEFDINATSLPSNPVKELTIKLNYIQDNGQTLAPVDPPLKGDAVTPLSCFDHIETPEYTVLEACPAVAKQLLQTTQGLDESEAAGVAGILCSEAFITIPEAAVEFGASMEDLANYGAISLNPNKNISIITGYHCGGSVTEWENALPLTYSYDGEYMDVIIPDKIDGVPVTKIAPTAFRHDDLGSGYDSVINSIKIPNGVTSIPISAFYYNQLTSVTISENVTSIGENAFYKNRLETVTFLGGYNAKEPSQLSIGTSAFNSNKIKNLSWGDYLMMEEIGASSFANNQLTDVTIPLGVKTIGASAFANNKINKLTFLGNVIDADNKTVFIKTIGEGAFKNNQLETLLIPNGVELIGNEAFSNNNIKSLDFYLGDGHVNNLKTIGDSAFYGNPISTMGSISGSLILDVKDIGANAFYGNKAASVRLGSSTRTIGEGAFAGGLLQSVRIDASQNLVTLGNNVFGWANGLSDANIEWTSN